MGFLPLILRRARRHWQILLTLILGVVLATALLASGPLLVDTVVEMGLHLSFQSASASDGNLRLSASMPADQAAFQTLDSQTSSRLQTVLGKHLDRVTRSLASNGIYPWVGGQLAADQQVQLRFYEGVQDQVEIISGDWPIAASDDPQVIRAAVGDGVARALVLRPGDRLPLSTRPDSAEPELWIEVAAVVRPYNPRDPYWYGEFNPLAALSTQDWAAQYSVLVPEEVFFTAASSFAAGEMELAWHALLRHDSFAIDDLAPFQAQLSGLETELTGYHPPVTMQTRVGDILATFQRQLETVRVPLYIFVAEVMLLVLYYVTMVGALSIRQVEREFAILHSRGTSGWQIARIQIVEALIIVALGLIGGPWLGAALVRSLSWVGPLAELSQAAWRLGLGQSAWLAAGLGALACLLGLLLPLGPALRRSIVTHQQMVARSTRPLWWQRFYLDVFALVGGLVLLWRLRLYGEMTTGGPGGARLDWLLLLAPVAFLLGAATILLRVFPLILRALAHLVARGEKLEGALALWQTSRNPTHVSRLVLLLTLAIALGNLSTGLNITLDQSEYDRATYLAGNDLRLSSEVAVPLVDLQSEPGVLALSSVWRDQGEVILESSQTTNPGFEILAIDPDSFSKVTTYRQDYSDRDMGEMLSQLAVQEGEHPSLLLLPGQPAKFGVWVWGMPEDKAELDSYLRWIDGDSDAERVGLTAKMQTAQGELFTANLQREENPSGTDHLSVQMDIGGQDLGLRFRIKPDNQGWIYYEGALPALPASSYPLNLHSLWFQGQVTRLGEPVVKGIAVLIDDLTVVDAETQEATIVEDFEDPDRTVFLNIMEEGSIHVGLHTQMVETSRGAGRASQVVYMNFSRPWQSYPLRLRQSWTTAALPAIASPAFLAATELEVGDVVRARIKLVELDLRIVGAVRYFPTMYEEQEAGYLISSRDLLLALLNDTSELSTNPNEVLIETDRRTSVDTLSSLVPLLSESWEAEGVRQALKANPLALGLRGVTFFGSALTILLSLVGFATHFYMTVRQREMLYGVMQAMGMAARQLYTWIVLEQALLILAGLVLGTGLGVLLNQITLPRLPVSLGEGQPIPPFVPRTDWLALGALYLLLALAFALVLGIVTALLRRARIHRILRIGQE